MREICIDLLFLNCVELAWVLSMHFRLLFINILLKHDLSHTYEILQANNTEWSSYIFGIHPVSHLNFIVSWSVFFSDVRLLLICACFAAVLSHMHMSWVQFNSKNHVKLIVAAREKKNIPIRERCKRYFTCNRNFRLIQMQMTSPIMTKWSVCNCISWNKQINRQTFIRSRFAHFRILCKIKI